jgi:predicted RNA binding protein YcfA (HicA-like mRNA interferase family)
MTQTGKLYSALLANPRMALSFRDFEKLLRAFGFELARTTGSHRQYVHARVPRPLPVQPSAKEAKAYQVRQFLDMIEEFGLRIEE